MNILLARNAPVGVILRRGPTDWVRLIKWHTDDDTFELGHWFHGHIYEHCSSLSPDGNKLIYGASQYHRQSDLNAWTAISKPPWLTAIVFWPAESTWEIGGRFKDDNTVCLRLHDHKPIPRDPLPTDLKVLDCHSCSSSNNDVNVFKEIQDDQVWPHKVVQCKPHTKGHLGLIKTTTQYKDGRHRKSYGIRNLETMQDEPLKGIKWADWDQRGRLVYPKEGKLFASEVSEKAEILPAKELADFNDQKPEPIEPPDWAKVW